MGKVLRRFLTDTYGATAIEYGLIAVVIIAVVSNLGTALSAKFNQIANNLS